jgi:hypothetical protein
LNLKFLSRTCRDTDRNFKFAALELRFRSSQAIAATSDAKFGIKGALATCRFQCISDFISPEASRFRQNR